MATRKAARPGAGSKKAKKAKVTKAKPAKPARRPRKAAKKAPAKKAPSKKKPAKARKPATRAPARKKPAPPVAPPTVRRRTTPLSDYWRKLNECGWLGEIPEAEHRGLRERLTAALVESPSTAYQALAVTSLDPECIEGAGPDEVCSYHSVLKQLADCSFGRFQPEDILDELDPSLHVARVSFCLGELSFHCEVPFRDDWVQQGVLDLVNRALDMAGVAARFQALPPDSQIVPLAFISAAVFRRAQELGLIPDRPSTLSASAPVAPAVDDGVAGMAPDAG